LIADRPWATAPLRSMLAFSRYVVAVAQIGCTTLRRALTRKTKAKVKTLAFSIGKQNAMSITLQNLQ
jgi:hypothetical protein